MTMGIGDTDRLIREAEKIREDLLRLAGNVGAWVEQLAEGSAVLRNDQAVREGNDCDDSGESGGSGPGERSDPGGHSAEPPG